MNMRHDPDLAYDMERDERHERRQRMQERCHREGARLRRKERERARR